MNNETIKEGDYVEYAGRPNEKFLVKRTSNMESMYIDLGEHRTVYFYDNGMLRKGDFHPVVKKTTPPKKKVVKEFEVELEKTDIGNAYYIYNFPYNKIPTEKTKAKLLIEVEE